MKRLFISLMISILASLAFTLPAFSASDERRFVPRTNLFPQERRQQSSSISKREASDLARENFDGRVLNVVKSNNNWRVRMDSDGTVFNVFVNASSGVVSRQAD